MRINQKYTKEEMYKHIVRWQDSGLTQKQYSEQEGFPLTTFSYWIIKYRKQYKNQKTTGPSPFVPVKITSPAYENIPSSSLPCITISYPSGIRVTCPATIGIDYLQNLIKL